MTTNAGFATLSVIPSLKGFESRLERGTNPALTAAGLRGGARFGDAAGKSAGSRFGRVFSTAAKASLIGAAGAGVLAFKVGSDAVQAASDQAESINAVNVAYGKQARAVQRLGRQSAKSLALPRTEFNELATRFSNFARTVAGGNGKKTVKTLDDLTTRAADFASVFNTDVNEAATLFQSGLAGETEPLRRFGIDMSAAAVEAFAYANGIAEAGSKLTESEKVQARYALLMQQTKKVQGDLANTSDSLANRQRFLNARWDDARAKLGTALLPIVEDFTGFLLDKGIPAVEDFSDWFTKTGGPAMGDFVDEMKPLAKELLPAAADTFRSVRDFAKEGLPFVKDTVNAFNDMPDWMRNVLIGGFAGGAAAKKLGLTGLGKSLGGGLLSKGGTPANPLYVVDVTKGGGGGKAGRFSLLGALGTAGLVAGIAGGITAGVSKALGPGNQSLLNAGSGGSGSAGTSFFDLDGTKGLDSANEKVKQFNSRLSETQSLWVDARLASADYAFQVKNGIPRSALTTMTDWPLWNARAKEYLATILAIRSAHMDTRLDRAGGSGTTPGSGVSQRGVSQRGMTVYQTNNYHVPDLKEADRRNLRTAHNIAAGGFGRP